jgi:hypothetical protein
MLRRQVGYDPGKASDHLWATWRMEDPSLIVIMQVNILYDIKTTWSQAWK